MVSRRGPRWMFWPAKLLWVPLSIAGLALTIVTRPTLIQIGDGQFRVGLRLFEPAGWTLWPVLHGVGLVLLLAGLVFLSLYTWSPGSDRRGVIEEFPLWTLSAWAFLAVSLGATWRLTGHVLDVDSEGVEWRFLAQLRTHSLDRMTAVGGLLAALGCAVLSYGRSALHRHWIAKPNPKQGP